MTIGFNRVGICPVLRIQVSKSTCPGHQEHGGAAILLMPDIWNPHSVVDITRTHNQL